MKLPRKSNIFLHLLAALTLLVLGLNDRASAQTVQQTITLRPGWNAVFLEVEPQDTACATVFQGLPVESVWMWNPQTSFVEYIQNPNELKPKDPEWLVWFSPTLSYNALLTNLFHIMGERAYLIKLTGTANVVWNIVGAPKLPRITWIPKSPNLVGFHLTPGQEPTFAAFFTPSNAHGNALPTVYRLNTAGTWVLTPATTQMKSGEAYWIPCDEASDYVGPLSVSASGDILDFGSMGVTQKLTLQNHTTAPMTITITPQASSSSGPPVNGMVPLSRYVDTSFYESGWETVSGAFALSYAAGQTRDVQFAVRRTALPAPGTYQSLLEVTNGAGMRVRAPVSTGAEPLAAGKLGDDFAAPVDGPPDYTGLWYGTATITKVSYPADGSNPDTPQPTTSEFTLPLIIHVPQTGPVTLLREVAQLWKRAITDADGNVTEPGREALFTDDALLQTAITSGDFVGLGVRDGRAVGRRISSAGFSFAAPLPLTGSFALTGALTSATTIGFNDPLNPFKHKYHPDHDNLDSAFQPITSLSNAEAYEITRTLTLTFSATDPDQPDNPAWGDTTMGGVYREAMTGLHRNTLYVEGTFRLEKISAVGVLNDER